MSRRLPRAKSYCPAPESPGRPRRALAAKYKAKRTLDAAGKVVMPGLNQHSHGRTSIGQVGMVWQSK